MIAETVTFAPDEHADPVLAAVSVAAAGWPVLAIRTGSKRPLHGGAGENHRDAWLSSVADVIDASLPAQDCWCSPSFAAITGQPVDGLPSGRALVCLDLDGDGDALDALLAEAGPEAQEWAAETLRVQRCDERAHLWGTIPVQDCPGTARLSDGLEWRGQGGYVMLPGALHPSGSRYAITGGLVEFTDGPQPEGAVYMGIAEGDEGDPLGAVAWAHPLPMPDVLVKVLTDRLTEPERAPQPPAPAPTAAPSSLAHVRRRVQGLVSRLQTVAEGGRDNAANWAGGIAGALLVGVDVADRPEDLTDEAVRAALVAAITATRADGTPGRPGPDARRAVLSGWTWGAAHPADALRDRPERAPDPDGLGEGVEIVRDSVRDRFPRRDLAALVDPDRPPREWVWQDVVPAGALGALVGPSGKGKSLLALALSLAVARGDDTFAGLAVTRRRVLYVDTENSEDDLAERLTALGVTPANVGDLADLVFLHLPPLAPLDGAAGAADFVAIVEEYGLRPGDLVVLDSTQRVTQGNENDADTMRSFYRHTGTALRRLRLTMLRTDNTGKDHDKGARGTSGKRDDLDFEWLLRPDARDPDVFTLSATKARSRAGSAEVLTLARRQVFGVLQIVQAKSTFGDLMADAMTLLDDLGVSREVGQIAAWEAVREARTVAEDSGQDFPTWATRNVIRKAQAGRRPPIELVSGSDAEEVDQ